MADEKPNRIIYIEEEFTKEEQDTILFILNISNQEDQQEEIKAFEHTTGKRFPDEMQRLFKKEPRPEMATMFSEADL